MTQCGREHKMFEFVFQSFEHARLATEQRSRLVPCEECMKMQNQEAKS